MAGAERPWPWRYGAAVVVTALAILLALALHLQAASGRVFLAAVMLSTWFGGLGPGLLATLLSGGAILYLFADPVQRFVIADAGTAVDLAAFILVALLISSLHARLRAAWCQAEAARAEAEAALRARDELLAMVSHDLKNPLGAIAGWTQVAQRQVAQLPAPEDGRLAKALARIAGATTRMTRLAGELLDAAQLQMGRELALDRRPTDLVALAQQAVAEHAPVTPTHRLCLQATVPALTGEWDAARLERVLANLLSNAIKYSPAGGEVRVSVAGEATPAGSVAVLAVEDQGLGIPAADLSRVFERFYRSGNVSGRIRGTGIGLATARQIVRQHGGTIELHSQEGVGTTVTLRLPLGAERGARAA